MFHIYKVQIYRQKSFMRISGGCIFAQILFVEPSPRVDFNDTATAFSGRSDKAIKWEYQLFRLMNNPTMTNILTTMASLSIRMHLPVKWAIKKTVYEQFCGGETLEETIPVLTALEKFGISAIIDYGVEGKESTAEFERTKNELISIIRFAAGKKNIPFISCKVTGLTAFATLEKLNTGEELTTEEQAEKDALYARMFAIAGAAADSGIGRPSSRRPTSSSRRSASTSRRPTASSSSG